MYIVKFGNFLCKPPTSAIKKFANATKMDKNLIAHPFKIHKTRELILVQQIYFVT